MKLTRIRSLSRNFDFAAFLRRVDKHCNTRVELIDMAEKEILKKGSIYLKPPALFAQQSYLKRLEGTIYFVKTGIFMEKDSFNYEVARLLDSLS